MLSRFMAVQIFVLLCLFAALDRAVGQSFDCATARLKAEKAVCSGRWLKKLDERLDKAYGRLRSSLAEGYPRRQLILSQRNWLRARNQCKANRRCLG